MADLLLSLIAILRPDRLVWLAMLVAIATGSMVRSSRADCTPWAGIRDTPIAPGSPWQNGFVERLIGSIRRGCLDHIIVSGDAVPIVN
jgi:transposase InsO family protein